MSDLPHVDPSRATLLGATLLFLPIVILWDCYYRVRYGIWLHRVVDDALAETINND